MQVRKLKLDNYRNYLDLDLEFPPGVVVFHGANGQGKTNLMESFHFLMRGESFRPAQRANLIGPIQTNVSEPFARVHANLNQNGLDHDLQMMIKGHSISLVHNSKRTTAAVMAKKFPIVMFSPESLGAIKSGPEERRRLIDSLLATHKSNSDRLLRDFRRALRTRNRILRDYRSGAMEKLQATALLESLDGTYFPLSAELAYCRMEAIQTLLPELNRAAKFVLESPNVDISVEYLVSGQNALGWSRSELLTSMHTRGQQLRAAELAGGISLVGPHKHDIRILFTGKDSRFYCSQGQQRALILSVKMAQILYHYQAYQVYPLLLLDDVLSELDPIRRTNLVQFLQDVPAQIFLTTTDLSFARDFGDRKMSLYRIENGCVQPQEKL